MAAASRAGSDGRVGTVTGLSSSEKAIALSVAPGACTVRMNVPKISRSPLGAIPELERRQVVDLACDPCLVVELREYTLNDCESGIGRVDSMVVRVDIFAHHSLCGTGGQNAGPVAWENCK